MYISIESLSYLGASNDTLSRVRKLIGNQRISLSSFLKRVKLQGFDYAYLIWFARQHGATNQDILELGISASKLILNDFEIEFPDDTRPRKALEIAVACNKKKHSDSSLAVVRSVAASRASKEAWSQKRYEASASAISIARIAWATWMLEQKPETAEQIILKVISYVSESSYLNEFKIKGLLFRLITKLNSDTQLCN